MRALPDVPERLHVAFEVEQELERGLGERVVRLTPLCVREAGDWVRFLHGSWCWGGHCESVIWFLEVRDGWRSMAQEVMAMV